MRNPLDQTKVTLNPKEVFIIQNFIKVVGTHYRFLNGSTVFTNQFSVNEYTQSLGPPESIGTRGVPGLFFHFDISPMLVLHEETQKSWSYFLTSLCAVVGGVFTVSGLIDTAFYRTSRALQKKMELGKVN
ncbi:Endoplasmic reticulum-Golgi intermediate compartment protein 3 [Coelomomyces lativittatus]|nr:Endoplasmic reticulum-Golgi intermediate compartment protein 3 [Coelomomyces lativittatus]